MPPTNGQARPSASGVASSPWITRSISACKPYTKSWGFIEHLLRSAAQKAKLNGNVQECDINAAINLKHMAVSSTATTCEEEGSDLRQPLQVKPAPMKQKAIFKPI